MNDEATLAIQWTRRQLKADQLEFLASLPLEAEDGDRLDVHASAAEPAAWDYGWTSAPRGAACGRPMRR